MKHLIDEIWPEYGIKTILDIGAGDCWYTDHLTRDTEAEELSGAKESSKAEESSEAEAAEAEESSSRAVQSSSVRTEELSTGS